jgi:hypothetical protein
MQLSRLINDLKEVARLMNGLHHAHLRDAVNEAITTVQAMPFGPQVYAALNAQTLQPVSKLTAEQLHYPKCWDTCNYPTLHDAQVEVGNEPFTCACQLDEHDGSTPD